MAETRRDRFLVPALVVVGASTMCLNLSVVPALAEAAGYPTAASYLYWFILDGYAAIAMRGALVASTVTARRWAGTSSVLALVMSAAAAGCHVFLTSGALPKLVAVIVLCAPLVILGLSLHLVLLLTLEGREETGPTEDTAPALIPGERAPAETRAIETTEDTSEVVTETVTTRRQVTARRTGKSAAFVAALKEVEPPSTMSVNDVVASINPTLPDPLHDASARKLVAQYRRGEV